jgi:glycosyltransferase involved in cell wall biosynthesis
MKEGPIVSICIPLWNKEEYIEEMLSSALNQTYKSLEIIISNNASTDRSIELINKFNDPRIKIYTNAENMGGMYNFRKVFTYATGKYMTYLSADDALDLTTIEKAVTILEDPKNQDIVLVNSYIDIINEESKTIFIKKYIFGGGRISAYWGVRSNFIYGSNILGEPNGSVWKKECYDKMPEPKFINGNDWTADLDIKMELLLQGNAYMIPEPLGKFRISSTSNSTTILKSTQAKYFREYVFAIYKDRRYQLAFIWVIIGSVTSFMMQIARNLFYKIFIKKLSRKRVSN